MIKLLNNQEKPDWFTYPSQFLRIVEQSLLYFDPWRILEGDELQKRFQGLKERYPTRDLTPFAKRDDSDDLACWDKEMPNKVVIVHDYAPSGSEQGKVLGDFWAWLRMALEDTISFEP